MMDAQWELYSDFTKAEFDCKHTGENQMKHSFLAKLQALRSAYGKPITISSGYRSLEHPIEKSKPLKNGAHPTGLAADIRVDRADAYRLLKLALELEFTGIGINQKAYGRFIHLDTIESNPLQPRPTIWSY
jgi:uncharacterized protein YcbK (DUF882 family)